MVHTRAIREAAAYFRESDPDTCLTEPAICTLLRTGVVPCARVGRKWNHWSDTLNAAHLKLIEKLCQSQNL